MKAPSVAASRRNALDHPVAPTGETPQMRETQQVECPRLRAGSISPRGFKPYQSSLVWVDRQAVPRKSLWKYGHHAPRVLFRTKYSNEVIRVTKQVGSTPEPGLDLLLPPVVQHFMEKHIGQHRRDDAALGGARSWVGNLPILHHTRFQPLADQSQYPHHRPPAFEAQPGAACGPPCRRTCGCRPQGPIHRASSSCGSETASSRSCAPRARPETVREVDRNPARRWPPGIMATARWRTLSSKRRNP